MKKILITVALLLGLSLSLYGERRYNSRSYNRSSSSYRKPSQKTAAGNASRWSSPGIILGGGGGEGLFTDENYRMRENINERALSDNMLERINPNPLISALVVGSGAYLIARWANNKFIIPELEHIEAKIDTTSKENNELIIQIKRLRNSPNATLSDADAFALELYEKICQQCSEVYDTIREQLTEQINKKQ